MDTLDEVMVHTSGKMEWNNVIFNQAFQNGTHFKNYELFVS